MKLFYRKVLVAGCLLIASFLSILISCNKENPTEPVPEEFDLFSDIDTTLDIQTIKEGELTIYKIDKFSTVVVKIPRITSYLYFPETSKSLAEIAQDSNYTLVVNSSYFDIIYDDPVNHTGRKAVHAGYLKINNLIYENIKDDRQLTSLLAYKSKENLVDYFSINDLDKTKDYDLVVQTGPRIIRDNEIDTAHIKSSFNGEIPWARTAFASVNGKEFYIIVNLAYDPVTLIELGKMLRSSGIFKKKLDIINFDGGFSTSLYIKNHPELSTNPEYKMPFVIGVR